MKHFKILMVASPVLLTASFALAQTWTQTSAPETNWTAVASSADGAKLVAVADPGGIWVSTNSGDAWIQTSAPQSGWFRVAASADGTGLAAIGEPTLIRGSLPPSYTGSFYTSTNSGANWISNNVPKASKLGATSCSLASSADGQKLAALISSALYTSTNSGAAWITNSLPSGIWNSVACSADGTRLIVGGLEILVSTNSGNGWILTNPVAASFVASSADGAKCAAIGGQLIYISTNSGMTWAQTSAPATNWVALVFSADGSRLAAVAGGSHTLQNPVVTGPIYTSTNGGATWTSNNVPVHNWISVASSADGCILVAADAGILSSNVPDATVGGGIWISRATPGPQLNIIPTNGNFKLSWIIPSANFTVQQSSDLSSWSDMTNLPVLNLTNLQNEVILSPTGSNVFYRLKTP
jgi:hypothetical protein